MREHMDLQNFIKNTLVQIALGVKEANNTLFEEHEGEYSESPFRLHSTQGDNKDHPGVSFDVGVIVTEGSSDKAGGKLSVVNVLGINGSTESIASDKFEQRIKFIVGLSTNWE